MYYVCDVQRVFLDGILSKWFHFSRNKFRIQQNERGVNNVCAVHLHILLYYIFTFECAELPSHNHNSIVFPLRIEHIIRCHCSRRHSTQCIFRLFDTFGFTGYILASIFKIRIEWFFVIHQNGICGEAAAVGLALLIKSKHSLEYAFSFPSFRMHKRKMRRICM